MDSIKSHLLHFRRSLKTVSFYTRPFYTLWQVNQYIFAWNVAAFNEIVTRNVFIALSPYFWNRSKRSNEEGKGHHPPGGRYITSEKRARIDFLLGWQPAPWGWSNMTNYCCPASVPSSLPLHAFPPVISHASTRPSVWSRVRFTSLLRIREPMCGESTNQCLYAVWHATWRKVEGTIIVSMRVLRDFYEQWINTFE